jgi:hypothetical protein
VVGVVVSKLDALQVASLTRRHPAECQLRDQGRSRPFDASGISYEAQEDPATDVSYPIPFSRAAVGAEAKTLTVLVECWK